MPRISLPNGWAPRDYQRPLWNYLEAGGKRAIVWWHRRAGKDDVVLHSTACAAFERVGNYWHCLPEYSQARKALWDSVNPKTGKRRIDEAFPPELRETTREQEMFVQFKNGSTFQLIGSDRYNATVGAGPVGITYSEWALANPSAWAYHRPMLEENGGRAVFITTPRGKNHAAAMLDMARSSPHWFSQVLTVDDTGQLSPEALAEALAEYQALYGIDMGRAMFEQEYYCSRNAAVLGSYFGPEIAKAEREGRFRPVPIDRSQPVHSAWDLGKAANNPLWLFQIIGRELRIVDFYEPESEDLADWCAWLAGQAYFGDDWVPHDVLYPVWGQKTTRLDVLKQAKRKPRMWSKDALPMAEGLQAGRHAINSAVFHTSDDERGQRVAKGVEGLKSYRREWDDERKTFRDTPVKDWAEHIGSAWRHLGFAWRIVEPRKERPFARTDELIYTVGPNGVAQSNIGVRDAIEAMIKRKRGKA